MLLNKHRRAPAGLALPAWRFCGSMEMKKEKITISGGRTLIYYTFTKDKKKTGERN